MFRILFCKETSCIKDLIEAEEYINRETQKDGDCCCNESLYRLESEVSGDESPYLCHIQLITDNELHLWGLVRTS